VVETSNALAAISEMHDRQIVACALVLINSGEQVSHDADITDSGVI
jgi:hypothetical protein